MMSGLREREAQLACERAFDRATTTNTVTAFDGFIANHQECRLAATAVRLRDQFAQRVSVQRTCDDGFKAAKVADTSAAYERFAEAYPDCQRAPLARQIAQVRREAEVAAQELEEQRLALERQYEEALAQRRQDEDAERRRNLEEVERERDVREAEARRQAAEADMRRQERVAEERRRRTVSIARSHGSIDHFSTASPFIGTPYQVDERQAERHYRFGEIEAVLFAPGDLSVYNEKLARMRATSKSQVPLRQEYKGAFAYSGRISPGSRMGSYILGLRDRSDGAILKIKFPVNAAGHATKSTQNTISQIARSAWFGPVSLPCAK